MRPSNDLTFSPLITTSNDGRSWSNGLLNQGLASRPQALAAGPGGAALAIVAGRGGANVLRNTKDLSAWQTVTTGRTLASSPSSRACGPGAITSVGYLSDQAVIGTSCDRGGEAGIFIERGGTWQLAGPPLGSRSGRAEVLGILPSTGGVAVLLGLTGANGFEGEYSDPRRHDPHGRMGHRQGAVAHFGPARRWAGTVTWSLSELRRRVPSSQ